MSEPTFQDRMNELCGAEVCQPAPATQPDAGTAHLQADGRLWPTDPAVKARVMREEAEGTDDPVRLRVLITHLYGIADALAAALEQARAERDEMMDILGIGPAEDQRPRIATLEAERNRYKAALAEIENGPVGYWNNSEHGVKVWERMVQIARAALHPEAGKVNASEAQDGR